MMTKQIRLFEKQANGGLVEVKREIQGKRRISRVAIEIDVLWTADEEAARDTEEKAVAVAKAAAEQAAHEQREAAAAARAAATKKLKALGLTEAEASAVTGGDVDAV